jgi:hypothetical protein
MYMYFDLAGETGIPTRADVVRFAAEQGVLTALVLDANVCLDLAAFGPRQSHERALEASGLLQAITDSGIDVVPGFGLVELSIDRSSWLIDEARATSLELAITRSIESVPGRREQRGSFENPQSDHAAEGFRVLVPRLKVFYASLLRIALIASRDVGRDNAIEALERFLHCAATDLDCMSAFATQAALAIFGGDTLARRLIAVGRASATLNDVWSGAWDTFYAQMVTMLAVHGAEGTPHRPIFVMRDRGCFQVFSKPRLRGTVRFSEQRRNSCSISHRSIRTTGDAMTR